MSHRKIAFFGNCQAAALCRVYEEQFAPHTGDLAVYCSSYDAIRDHEVGQRHLREADAVVVQVLDFPTQVSADDIRRDAKLTFFPSVVLGFLWPFYGQMHPKNQPKPFLAPGPYAGQLGDRFLNGLIGKGVDPEAALEQYLAYDFASRTNLDRLFEVYQERQAARDARTGFDLRSVIDKHFRDEALVFTPDHPDLRLFEALARQCYLNLGLSERMIDTGLSNLPVSPFPLDQLPIHPSVARHFGLRFADETTVYLHQHEGRFTFAEYAKRYMGHVWTPALHEGWSGQVDPAVALAKLDEGLAVSPNAVRGWTAKSRILLELRRPEDARAAAESALRVEPGHPDGAMALARAELALGNLDEAEAAARDGVAHCPRSAPAHWTLAEILFARGRREEAFAEQQKGIDLLPGDAYGYAVMGTLRLRNGEPDQAEALLRRALALRPEDNDAAGQLAECLRQLGRTDEAVILLKGRVGPGPGGAQIHARLGELLARSGDLSGAEAAFRQAIAADPQVEAFHDELAGILDMQGRLAEAVGALRALIAASPGKPQPCLGLGRLLARAGDLAGSEAALREALALGGGSEAQGELAALLERSDQIQEATRLTRLSLAQDPRNPHMQSRLGRLLLRSGDLPGAESAFRQAIALDAAVAGFHHELSNVLAQQERLEEAIAASRAAVEADPRDAHAHAGLGHVLMRSGALGPAEEAFRAAIGIAPEIEGFRSALAGVLEQKNGGADAEPPESPDAPGDQTSGALAEEGQGAVPVGPSGAADPSPGVAEVAIRPHPATDSSSMRTAPTTPRAARQKTVLFFGNCQAHGLAQFCADQLADHMNCRVEMGDPNLSLTTIEHMQRQFDGADIIVRQQLEHPVLPELVTRDDTVTIYVPFVSGFFLWPYGNVGHPNNGDYGPAAADFGDRFLNGMINQNVPGKDAVARYLDLNVSKAASLDRLFDLHIEGQRMRDTKTGFSIAPKIEADLRDELLFASAGHLSLSLFAALARQTFARLEVPDALVEAGLKRLMRPPFEKRTHAVHPAVIEHFNLRYLNRWSTFDVFYDGTITFSEWARRYVDRDWSSALIEGIFISADGNHDVALRKLDQGLRERPNSRRGWYAKASSHLMLGQLGDAEVAARCALTFASPFPDEQELLARVLLAMGRTGEAEFHARQAVALFPRSSDAHAVLAEVQGAAGNAQGAVLAAGDAVRHKPGDAHRHACLADFLIRTGRSRDAETALRKALSLARFGGELQEQLLGLLESDQRWTEVIELIREFLRVSPDDPDLHLRLGRAFRRVDQVDAAAEAFNTAIALGGKDAIQDEVLDMLERAGRFAQAARVFEETLADRADNPHAQCRLGVLLSHAGDLAGAEAAFRRAVALDPETGGFHHQLAGILSRQGRLEEAVAASRRSVELSPDDPHIRAGLGHILALASDLHGAERAFLSAVELDPRTEEFRFALASILTQRGRGGDGQAAMGA